MKIGLVQSRAVKGDLSGNLRRVVQGVRASMDAGAQMVVAGAAAADGVSYGEDVGGGESYRLQARAALAALAEELSIPLILASSAAEPGETTEPLRPFLLHEGEVRLLRNHAPTQVGELSVWVDAGEQPQTPPPDERCAVVLHLPTTRWHLGQNRAAEAQAEADAHGYAVLTAQSLGCGCEGSLQAGGSAAAAPGGRSVRLPDFAEGECVWHPAAAEAEVAPLATAADALMFYLRETLAQRGANGYAVAAESPTAPLLCALVQQAVGRKRLALRPQRTRVASDALRSRCRGARLTTWAEEHDYILLNPLSRNQLLLGGYTAPATLYGTIAPLADLWESELAELWRHLLPGIPCPRLAEDEQLLRELLTHSHLRYLDTPAENAALRLQRRLTHAPRHSWPTPCRM